MLFIVEGKTEKKSADLFVVATLAAGYRRYSQRRRRHTQQLSFRRQKFKNFFLPCAPLCFVSLRKYNNAFLGVLVACAKFFFFFSRSLLSSLGFFFCFCYFFNFIRSLLCAQCTTEKNCYFWWREIPNVRLLFKKSTIRLNENSTIHRFCSGSRALLARANNGHNKIVPLYIKIMCLSSVYGARCCAACVCVPWCVVITLSCLMCFTLFLPLQYCLSGRELARTLTCVTALLCGTFQMFCFDIVTYAHFSLSSLDFFIVRQMCLLPFFYPFFFLTCCFECTLQFAVDEFASATYGRKYTILCIYGICRVIRSNHVNEWITLLSTKQDECAAVALNACALQNKI